MQNIKLILEYDGTRYRGFSARNSSNTIHEKLTNALTRLTSEDISLYGAVQTDPGVHAKSQTVHFKPENPWSCDRLIKELNHILPKDIAVRDATVVPERFHAALNLVSCTYVCRIDTRRIPDPFCRNYTCHLPYPLDIDAMRQAAFLLCGTHDFTPFSSGRTKKSCIRSLTDIELITTAEGAFLELIFTADSFLRRMPQLMAGTLVDIGLGKLKPEDIKRIFSGELTCASFLPSGAFCLTETNYL